MKALKNRFFSLVELALAVGILAVGAIAIVTLIPVGIKENREATHKNYVALTLQDVQTFITIAAEADSKRFDNLIASLPNSNPDSPKQVDSLSLLSLDNTDTQNSGTLIYKDPNNSGVYAVKIMSGNNIDFVAQLNIWQSDPSISSNTTNTFGGLPIYKQDTVRDGDVSPTVQIPNGKSPDIVITTTPDTGKGGDINPSGSEKNNEFKMTYIDENGEEKDMEMKNKDKESPIDTMKEGTYKVKFMHIRLQGSDNVTIPGVDAKDVGTGNSGKVKEFTSGSEPFAIKLVKVKDKDNNKYKWSIETTYETYPITTITPGSTIFKDIAGVKASPTTGFSAVKGINVELSWPMERPYDKRDKYKSYFEVSQPSK